MENIKAAMPHTPTCVMLKRNMCSQRKQGKAAVIKVVVVSLDLVFNQICFTAGTRFFVVYFQSNSDTTLAKFDFSLVIYHTTRSKHVNWNAWYLRVTGPQCVII